MKPILYHNPRCSKSRAALALLLDRGIEPDVVRYLDRPPDLPTLQAIATALDEPMGAMIRPQEKASEQAGQRPEALQGDELLRFIAENPRVMQRPILVVGRRARIGRPPEKILEILPE